MEKFGASHGKKSCILNSALHKNNSYFLPKDFYLEKLYFLKKVYHKIKKKQIFIIFLFCGILFLTLVGDVAELVDATDLKSVGFLEP